MEVLRNREFLIHISGLFLSKRFCCVIRHKMKSLRRYALRENVWGGFTLFKPIYLGSARDLFYHDHTGGCETATRAQAEPALGQGWLQKAAMARQEVSPRLPRGSERGKPQLPTRRQSPNRLRRGKGMSTTFRTAINYFPGEQRCNCDEIKRWENIAEKFNAFSAIAATAAKLFLIPSLQQR